jgi:ribose transport system substrate-binding protein
MPMKRRAHRRLAILPLLPLVAFLAGCGSGTSTQAQGTTSTAQVAAAKAFVAGYMNTDERPLPTSSPKPQPGKNVWIISCSQAAEACATSSDAAEEAGKLIGWDMHIFDGKGDPANYAKGINTAVADGAQAIILVVVDCDTARAPLQAAHNAGVKIYGIYSVDCGDQFGGPGPGLFDAEITFNPKFGSMTDDIENSFARLIAEWTIWKTDGKADIIAITEDDLGVPHQTSFGYLHWIATDCPGCKVTQLPIAFSDLLEGKLQAMVAAALTREPNANVVMAPYDALVVGGVAAAVEDSGRGKQILVTGAEGLAPNIAMIRSGTGQDLAVGAPSGWAGFAAIDGVNRLFHGTPQVDAGIGQAVIDRDHNLPTKTPYYDGKADYEANYKKIWGLG